MIGGALDPHHQMVLGQLVQQRVVRIERVHNLTGGAAAVADKVAIAIQILGAFDEMRRVIKCRHFGAVMLGLARLIFGKAKAAQRRIARFAQIGRQGRQVLERKVRRDIDAVGSQKLRQKGVLHGAALEVVGDVLAHIARADTVIGAVVKPVTSGAQHVGDMRFSQAGHAEEQHLFALGLQPVLPRIIDHPNRSLSPRK
ncbi:RelA/SpoT AH/RIS domain-containing protein [Litoreibacter albidus]|uniref:RelA/SpoT AH/RIS domain-containing protein n=1 Tax=Litoreibacter albidus TaxID=670155 RepID=UPI003734FCEE